MIDENFDGPESKEYKEFFKRDRRGFLTEDDDDLTIIAPIIGHTNVWYSRRKMEVIVILYVSGQRVEVPALIDSGAAGVFIDEDFIKKLDLLTESLPVNIEVYNVDGTVNQNGSITKKVVADLELKGKCLEEEFLVTALGRQRIILGYPWLKRANPKINWMKKEFSWWDEGLNRISICSSEKLSKEMCMRPRKISSSPIFVLKYEKLMMHRLKNSMGNLSRFPLQLLKVQARPCWINGFKTR